MKRDMRVWACKELLKRYMVLGSSCIKLGEYGFYNDRIARSQTKQKEMVIECMCVISDAETKPIQKKAARFMLEVILGKERSNDLVEEFAVVTDRNDPLVNRWRKRIIKRDGKCLNCGSEDNLHAHHVSHWADDPINRINDDNGIALCSKCHAKEHPELEGLILSRGCS